MKKLVLAILIGILSLGMPAISQANSESASDGTRAQSIGLLRGEDFGNLNGAINYADGSNVTLEIAQPLTVLNSVTVPSTMTLEFLNGGKLAYDVNASGTVTVTINGPIWASPGTALFSGSSLAVVINAATTPITYTAWGTFTTTGTAPVNSIQNVQYGTTSFVNGSYVLSFAATPYTNSTSYVLTATTHGTGGTTSVTKASGTSATVNGSGSDTFDWTAIGK
jgi:hypothetical protein